jgi:hypothetical protein
VPATTSVGRRAKHSGKHHKLVNGAESHQDDKESKALAADDIDRHGTVSPSLGLLDACLSPKITSRNVMTITMHGFRSVRTREEQQDEVVEP